MRASVADIIRLADEADMVLVGIGEEFEDRRLLTQDERYVRTCEEMRAAHMEWAAPYVNAYFLKKNASNVINAYAQLHRLLEGKNYFVVSVCMDGLIRRAGLREDRIVEPCGGYFRLQCADGCAESLEETPDTFLERIEACCEGKAYFGELALPVCASCGGHKVFNSLYTEKYAEEGYRERWTAYGRWLEGTLNRNVCVLELGVGMKYPTVIRWPFEKAAYYNHKARFVRVHEKLYQLSEGLSERGSFVPLHAVKALSEIKVTVSEKKI